MLSDEIKDGAYRLAGAFAQSTSELLKEQERTLVGRSISSVSIVVRRHLR
jgi:hypothetical protein